MSIKAAISSHLKADAGVAAIVGEDVYQHHAPQTESLPYVTMDTITAEHHHHQRAASGLVQSSVQISCYSATPAGATALAEAVREALDVLHHVTMGNGANTETLRSAMLDQDIDFYEPPESGQPHGTYSVRQDWTFWHTETVPTH